MEIQQVNRTDADKIFINVLNADVDSLTTGYGAAFCVGANSFNGATVWKTDQDTTAGLRDTTFVGVAAADIAPNAIGRVQIWGFADSVYLSNVGTSITINSGDALTPGDAPGGFFSAVPTYLLSGFKWIICSNPPVAVSASGYCSGIVRGL